MEWLKEKKTILNATKPINISESMCRIQMQSQFKRSDEI